MGVRESPLGVLGGVSDNLESQDGTKLGLRWNFQESILSHRGMEVWALLPRQGKPGFEPRRAATRPASCGVNISDGAQALLQLEQASSCPEGAWKLLWPPQGQHHVAANKGDEAQAFLLLGQACICPCSATEGCKCGLSYRGKASPVLSHEVRLLRPREGQHHVEPT